MAQKFNIKKHFEMTNYLSPNDFAEINEAKTFLTNPLQIGEVISLIGLCQSVSQKYAEGSDNPGLFEYAVKGMARGLAKYRDLQRSTKDLKLSTYLSWYMKTAIEYELGMKNEDTKEWNWDKI